jgi:hypothetical protein
MSDFTENARSAPHAAMAGFRPKPICARALSRQQRKGQATERAEREWSAPVALIGFHVSAGVKADPDRHAELLGFRMPNPVAVLAEVRHVRITA